MPLPRVLVRSENAVNVYCPFTGRLVSGPELDGPALDAVLFLDFGVGLVETSDPKVAALLEQMGEDEEEYVVDWLAARLDVPGAFLLQVDSGFGGVASYAFRPPRDGND